MSSDSVNSERLKKSVLAALDGYRIDVHVVEASQITKYVIRTKEATLEIAIGPHWIGYELHVDKSVLGKPVTAAEDTDNYPLDGRFAKAALEVFDQSLNCMKGLLEGGIYVGIIAKNTVLAIPLDAKRYSVSRRGRFIANESIVGTDEVKNMPGLRPLR